MLVCFVRCWRLRFYKKTHQETSGFSIFLYPYFADFYFRDQNYFPFLFSKIVIAL